MSAPTSPVPRVVLVTGGVRGLGLATARGFLARGDRVHVTYRTSRDAATALSDEFSRRVHAVDLADARAARALVERVIERDGRLDVLVHAIGDYRSGTLEGAGPDAWDELARSNVATALNAFDAARSPLRAARGAALFFTVSGLDGLRGKRDTALYAAAKSALLVLVRSWALEEAPHGVRVNALAPGIVPHPHAADDTHDARLHARIPLGRVGRLDDVAQAALFLCSDASAYVTGSELPVSGGWSP